MRVRPTHPRRVFPVIVAVVALLAAACGSSSSVDAGDDGTDSTDTSSTDTSSTATPSTDTSSTDTSSTDPDDDGSTTTPSDDPGASDDVVGPWILTTGTVDGQPLIPVAGYDVTLTIDADGGFGGTAACNGYGGDGTFADGSVRLGDYSITEMGCVPEVQELETVYMTGLAMVTDYEVDADRLRLFSDTAELIFAPVPPVPQAELVGTEWTLETMIDGDMAFSVAQAPILRLNEDGTFVASTGCRLVSGQWLISGGTIQFPSMEANGQCDPDEVDQDSFVISTLEGPATVSIDGPTLTLTAPGEQGLVYRADS